ncbi:hypothetical protein RJ639_047803 [Escallonia herrerae]|uniref:Cytochrome P450 n=1 Tax=Escallonia herrerae TaxID=1293975 RepID=A0AA88WA47_9ASTE|nr:hypothetical protein RJ639_047803 [Escallonia herrerae]
MSLSLEVMEVSWWVFTLPAILETPKFSYFILLPVLIGCLTLGLATWAAFPTGGPAWKKGKNQMGRVSIPGPRGLPILGSLFHLSHGLAHRTLASMAYSHAATQLMAFSLGSIPVVVASDPQTAREILTSAHFANRPIKQSAKQLMFSRAIGFAPNGPYWRLLRRIASSHLFAPKRILAYESGRQLECAAMLSAICREQSLHGFVALRKHLQAASLNNIVEIVFGKRYHPVHDFHEAKELHEIVREGFELLGAFNLSDYLPWLKYFYNPFRTDERCLVLVLRVRKFVERMIEEHRGRRPLNLSDKSDFVDVLLSLHGEEKLNEEDMVAVLWEMIFRGTDTSALLTEWVMAELVLNPQIQAKLQHELDSLVGHRSVTDADVTKLPLLQAVVKETLRVHPPGPLLSWSRLSTSDVHLSNGMVIPANTTAMVNMWAITHDPGIWVDPNAFEPERLLARTGGAEVDVRGGDLRLAPFGAGRRACPGANLGLATVSLWVAQLVHRFEWLPDVARPVELSEVLKLSCEMKRPLYAVAVPRCGSSTT